MQCPISCPVSRATTGNIASESMSDRDYRGSECVDLETKIP